MARNYKKEYAARADKIKAYRRAHKADDAARARARRSVGKIPAGYEVDHKDGDPQNNNRSNLQIVPRKVNRKKAPFQKAGKG